VIASVRGKEPATFDAQCRQKGLAWLSKNPDAVRIKDYWSGHRSDLARAAKHLCAYGAMFEPNGTVDHFVPSSRSSAMAYEWRNFRFATGILNSKKSDALDLLDPFEVKDGWFELLLPSLQLTITDQVPPRLRAKAQQTLRILGLQDHETLIRQRYIWYEQFATGKISVDALESFAPLLARAIRKRDLAATKETKQRPAAKRRSTALKTSRRSK
jgi:hypothetical protein